MIDELNKKLEAYFTQWQAVVADVGDLGTYKATAVGWKVADEAEYRKQYEALRPFCDKTVETWMNGRWIAKLHLKDSRLTGNIEIIKLMQRRPGSDDALGLDHVDFICNDVSQAEASLQASDLRWSWESNDIAENYDWISVWFDGGEAKIKQDTVIDLVVAELQAMSEHIKR